MIVVLRSRSDSMQRVAMIAGTVQPKPSTSGTKERPCSPNRRITPSITNAARAMYPESSRIAIAKKRKRMFGRKTSTPPTPAITPSVSRERR